jgi:fluoride exporter
VSALGDLALVFAGGGVGAAARHAVARLVARSSVGAELPLGTLAVNLSGSLFLGMVTGWAERGLSPAAQLLLATGLAGGYTTFSTLSYETVRLAEEGLWRAALLNPAVSLVAGLAAFAGGIALTQGVGV